MNDNKIVVIWLGELLVMAIIATFAPDSLVWNSMTGGITYSVLAWIPAIIFGVK